MLNIPSTRWFCTGGSRLCAAGKFFGEQQLGFAPTTGVPVIACKKVEFCSPAKRKMPAHVEQIERDEVQYSGSLLS